MTPKSLMGALSLGVFIWSLLVVAIHAHTQNWGETGKVMVLVVAGAVIGILVFLGVEADQQRVDEEAMRMRENEQYSDIDEYEEPKPPRAA